MAANVIVVQLMTFDIHDIYVEKANVTNSVAISSQIAKLAYTAYQSNQHRSEFCIYNMQHVDQVASKNL